MHVYLLHDIVLLPCWPRCLGALKSLDISLSFSCYRETALGSTGEQVHIESSRDREDSGPQPEC